MSRALPALAYVLCWLPFFVFRVESVNRALPFYQRGERIAVIATPLIVAAHVTLACCLMSLETLAQGRLALGAAICLAGVGFWFWGRGMIGPLRRRRLPQEAPLRFRRDGAFALVRHPLYFSYVLIAAAPVAATAETALAVSFAAVFAAIAVRAVQEERWLRRQLGAEYDAYCAQAKRLVPFVW